MVDKFGRWTPEDYSVYPKSKWCDMDYAASYIQSSGYTVNGDLGTYIALLLDRFFEDPDYLPKTKANKMINIPALQEYVEASGGLKEFEIY